MTSTSAPGRLAGALLLVVLVTGLIVPYVMLGSLGAPPAVFLERAARMSGVIRLAVLQLVLGSATGIVISFVVFPRLRARAPGLALWVVALAVTNFGLQLVENMHWLTMLSVSQARTGADPAQAAAFAAVGVAVRSAWKWSHYSHLITAVGWLFSFFLLLFRTRALPRVLPAVGMGLCSLQFVGITLPAFAGFRMPYPMLFGMPLAFGIFATSAWLLARGLAEPNPSFAARDAASRV